jgi:hypothetical protein
MPKKLSLPGTDVMILKVFSRNIFCEKKLFLVQNTTIFTKIESSHCFLTKNANILAKNWRKSPKIVIITSTPGAVHFNRKKKSFLCSFVTLLQKCANKNENG